METLTPVELGTRLVRLGAELQNGGLSLHEIAILAVACGLRLRFTLEALEPTNDD